MKPSKHPCSASRTAQRARRPRSIGAVSAALALIATACGVDRLDSLPVAGESGRSYEVVAWGLNSPRGLAVGANGDVYVSEAGSLGEDCVNPKDGPCFGFTSAIQRYTGLGTATSSRETLASGIVSMAMLRPEGPEVLGVAGIDLTDEGELVGIMMFSDPGIRSRFTATDPPYVPAAGLDAAITGYAGRLISVGDSGPMRVLADVGSENYAWAKKNKDQSWAPDGQFPDSNPYAVLADDGGRFWVADAGANAIVLVQEQGGKYTQKLVAFIPNPVTGGAAVPTCIARQGDWLYIGTLDFAGNFGGAEPTSIVFRVNVNATDPFTAAEAWAGGFDPITGCAIINGSLYVSEWATKATKYEFGAVVRIPIKSDGSAGTRRVIANDLVQPAGIAALGNRILVVNHSISPAGSGPGEPGGQIVRLFG